MLKNKVIQNVEASLYNYQKQPLTVIDIDSTIGDCYRALGPTEKFYYGIFTFIIDNRDQRPVHAYSNYLKLIVWETLIETLKIRPIRLSNIFIDRNNSDLIVTFTLVDNPPFYGPVTNPLNEPSLDAIIKNLLTLIDAKNISFLSIYNNTQGIRLYPKPGSLNVIGRTQTILILNNITEISYETVTNITRVRRVITRERSSGSKITGLWIGFLILGLVIGLTGSIIMIRIIAGRHR